MEFKDYYKTMGVDKTATQDEIKRAYRKLARKYHPDVSSEANAETRFKEVGEAYEVLKDPEKRAAYDELGRQFQAGQEFRPPPDWDSGFEFSEGSRGRAEDFGFSDFFESIYGRQHRAGGSRGGGSQGIHIRGEDHHAKVMIDIEDSYTGATRPITLRVPELTPDGHVETRNRTLNVRIPKGVRAGQQIRLAGQGGMGMGKGGNGDLFLEVQFQPHPRYRAEEGDIYLDLPVAPWEAALGARIPVRTPAGEVDLKIPPQSQAGKKLRIRGRGLPGKSPGDFYVVLKLVNPPVTSDKEREAWRTLQSEFAFNPRAGAES